MPTFVAALLGGLLNIAGSLAGRMMLALGFGVATYTGVSSSLGWLKTQAISALSGAPANLVQLLAFMKVGECISIVFSAILARWALNGLNSDTIKRLVLK